MRTAVLAAGILVGCGVGSFLLFSSNLPAPGASQALVRVNTIKDVRNQPPVEELSVAQA